MSWILSIKEEVINDLINAFEWYEKAGEDLGLKFIEEVDRLLAEIKSNPHIFQIREEIFDMAC